MKNISFLKMLDYPFSPKKWFRKEFKEFLFNGTKKEIPTSMLRKVESLIPQLHDISEEQQLSIRILL